MTAPVSPEVGYQADRLSNRRRLARKVRGLLLATLAGLALWAVGIYALVVAIGVIGR